MDNEFAQMNEKLAQIAVKIENDVATKSELTQHAELVKAMVAKNEKALMGRESNRVFGTKAAAEGFIDVMKIAAARANVQIEKSSPFYVSKADLDVTTGADAIPTATASTLSMLLEQGGLNRRECTVIPGIQGDMSFPKRNGTGTAAFTATDDASVTDDAYGVSKITLSPKQISALSYVSDKFLYSAAINVAEYVAIDLIEQAAKLEDESLIRGDGTAAYGSVTGLETASGLGSVSVAAASLSVDSFLDLIPQVHESVQSSKNAKFYVSAAALAALRTKKASTAGSYHIDPQTGGFMLAGRPIEIWYRLDNSVANGATPAFFGDLKKGVLVGTGRDMQLVADRSFKFGSNQTSFRLTYDWQAQVLQASAIAKLVITA